MHHETLCFVAFIEGCVLFVGMFFCQRRRLCISYLNDVFTYIRCETEAQCFTYTFLLGDPSAYDFNTTFTYTFMLGDPSAYDFNTTFTYTFMLGDPSAYDFNTTFTYTFMLGDPSAYDFNTTFTYTFMLGDPSAYDFNTTFTYTFMLGDPSAYDFNTTFTYTFMLGDPSAYDFNTTFTYTFMLGDPSAYDFNTTFTYTFMLGDPSAYDFNTTFTYTFMLGDPSAYDFNTTFIKHSETGPNYSHTLSLIRKMHKTGNFISDKRSRFNLVCFWHDPSAGNPRQMRPEQRPLALQDKHFDHDAFCLELRAVTSDWSSRPSLHSVGSHKRELGIRSNKST